MPAQLLRVLLQCWSTGHLPTLLNSAGAAATTGLAVAATGPPTPGACDNAGLQRADPQAVGDGEELRLLYVAMTRAQDHLYIMSARSLPDKDGNLKDCRPSPSFQALTKRPDICVVGCLKHSCLQLRSCAATVAALPRPCLASTWE